MKELLRTIAGSRLYGTALPTSDYDYKVVVMPSLDHLLLGKSLKNKFRQTATGEKNTVEDEDVEYIPLHTFVRDFVKGQTYALELAFCPALDGADPAFRDFVYKLRESCLTKEMSGLVGYCLGQARKYSNKGHRLNAVRLALDVFSEFPGDQRVADAEEQFKFLGNKYIGFAEDETHRHLQVCDNLFPFSIKVREAKERLRLMESSFGERARCAADFDGADWKALMHAVRLAFEAKELLTTHKITLPVSAEQREYLLSVRNGEVEFAEVIETVESLVDEVTDLSNQSNLPSRREVQELAENMLLDFIKQHITGDIHH